MSIKWAIKRLVVFEGDIYLDADGVYKTTEIDVGIKIEDLELCE